MFNRVPDVDLEPVPVDPAGLVPLSVLALEVPEPRGGWESRGVAVTVDDIGRRAVTRAEARRLLAEHAAEEERRRAERAAAIPGRKRGARRAPRGVPVPEGLEDLDALSVLKASEVGATPGELVVHRIPADPNQPREAGEFYRIKHGGAA